MNILIDADAIFALIVATDPNHKKAVNLQHKLKETTISILNTTIAEIATVLFRKVSHQTAVLFLKDVAGGDLLILTADERLMSKAVKYFQKQTAKNVSFFDCLNMAAVEEYGFKAIFSFDKGYQKNGFKLVSDC